MLALFAVLALIAFAMCLYAIHMFIEIGKAKGYSMDNAVSLWLIGIFTTPITVGIYVAALPDNRIRPLVSETKENSAPANADDDATTWTCACGSDNSNKFCRECGAPKPEGTTQPLDCEKQTEEHDRKPAE